jgi:hypothetical protein
MTLVGLDEVVDGDRRDVSFVGEAALGPCDG